MLTAVIFRQRYDKPDYMKPAIPAGGSVFVTSCENNTLITNLPHRLLFRSGEFSGMGHGWRHGSQPSLFRPRPINKDNVSRLRIAWTYDSGDAYPNSDVQCNPIVVGGVMYVTTAKMRVVALDAATGKQIWRFDGGNDRAMHPNRGVTYWTDGSQSRIFVTIGRDLLSIDAKTGKLALDFGNQGKVDLRTAFDRPIEDISLTVTTPGTIYKDLIILGSSVSETLPATPGDIRAYDVRTENSAGRSIQFRIQASSGTRRGRRTPGRHRAPLTTGQAWR